MNFGQQIEDLRKKEGLTHEQCALKLNVRRQLFPTEKMTKTYPTWNS